MLGDLQPVAGHRLAEDVHGLRQEVESCPVAMLPELARQALELSDAICWEALERGDSSGFSRYARGASELAEFTDCAGLLTE